MAASHVTLTLLVQTFRHLACLADGRPPAADLRARRPGRDVAITLEPSTYTVEGAKRTGVCPIGLVRCPGEARRACASSRTTTGATLAGCLEQNLSDTHLLASNDGRPGTCSSFRPHDGEDRPLLQVSLRIEPVDDDHPAPGSEDEAPRSEPAAATGRHQVPGSPPTAGSNVWTRPIVFSGKARVRTRSRRSRFAERAMTTRPILPTAASRRLGDVAASTSASALHDPLGKAWDPRGSR